MKPAIFIGSSSKALEIAKAVKEIFEAEHKFNAEVWSEGIFHLNASYMESLTMASYIYDFAILILAPDDIKISNGTTNQIARDNVTFEHGLFLGRLGPHKTFILADKTVKIPTDFSGISIAFYERKGNVKDDIRQACVQVKDEMIRTMKGSEIGFFPSTSLAVGYYENFVRKVVNALQQGPKIKIDDVEHTLESYKINILIPDDLAQVEPLNLTTTCHDCQLKKITLSTSYRDFPFFIDAKISNGLGKDIEFYDIPATLFSSRKAVEIVLKDGTLGRNKEDIYRLEKREIANFKKTLKFLIDKEFGKTNKLVAMESLDSFKSRI